MTSVDIETIEENYIGETDWEVKENANENRCFGNFINFFLDKTLKTPEVLNLYFPPRAVRMHFNGGIHIHKLPQSIWIPYCIGWSLARILKKGLVTPTVISKPAKHLSSAVNHLINFTFLAAQEFTGAMAFSTFDAYLAPFVRIDNLNGREVKQILQSLLFELNYPSRMGYQSPFSNITLVLDCLEDVAKEHPIIGGVERKNETLSDYLDEALLIVDKLCELYREGDAIGQPFTFPIPTLMITKKFDWNGSRWGDLTDKIFELLSKRGTFYLLNGYAADVEALYAMCCRLTIDVEKINKIFSLNIEKNELEEYLHKKGALRGIWAIPDATGSIGVITINLPRIAFMSKGEWSRFEELLRERLEIARETLLKMRKRYERSLKLGLMPLTKTYLGHFNAHYNTFGLVGLPEAAANFMRNAKLWEEAETKEIDEAVKIMKRMVSLVRKFAEEYEEKDGILYNVEEIPAESTAYKFAKLDYQRFKDFVETKEMLIPMQDGVPFYSNSIIPYYAFVPLAKRVLWEAEVQNEFTGGVMMHLFLYETPDPKALKKTIHKIVTQTKIVYFSITPTIFVCKNCKWQSVGMYEECPRCKSKNVDIWSRIVGYYRPIRNWNIGKRAEFAMREQYSASFSSTKRWGKL